MSPVKEACLSVWCARETHIFQPRWRPSAAGYSHQRSRSYSLSACVHRCHLVAVFFFSLFLFALIHAKVNRNGTQWARSQSGERLLADAKPQWWLGGGPLGGVSVEFQEFWVKSFQTAWTWQTLVHVSVPSGTVNKYRLCSQRSPASQASKSHSPKVQHRKPGGTKTHGPKVQHRKPGWQNFSQWEHCTGSSLMTLNNFHTWLINIKRYLSPFLSEPKKSVSFFSPKSTY